MSTRGANLCQRGLGGATGRLLFRVTDMTVAAHLFGAAQDGEPGIIFRGVGRVEGAHLAGVPVAELLLRAVPIGQEVAEKLHPLHDVELPVACADVELDEEAAELEAWAVDVAIGDRVAAGGVHAVALAVALDLLGVREQVGHPDLVFDEHDLREVPDHGAGGGKVVVGGVACKDALYKVEVALRVSRVLEPEEVGDAHGEVSEVFLGEGHPLLRVVHEVAVGGGGASPRRVMAVQEFRLLIEEVEITQRETVLAEAGGFHCDATAELEGLDVLATGGPHRLFDGPDKVGGGDGEEPLLAGYAKEHRIGEKLAAKVLFREVREVVAEVVLAPCGAAD